MHDGQDGLETVTGATARARRRPGGRRHRVVARILRHSWWLVAVAGGGGLILGYVGFDKYFALRGEIVTAWDIVYLVFQLIKLSSGAPPGPIPWELSLARFLLPTASAYAAVTALALVLRDQGRRARLRFARGHTVVCGLGRLGGLVAAEFARQGHTLAVIELDRNNPNLEACRQAGAVVILGDATRPAVLQSAGVERAKVLLAMCGADGTNAEIAAIARRLIRGRRRRPLTCVVRVSDPRLTELLRDTLYSDDRADGLRLELTNFEELAARALVQAHPAPAAGDGGQAPHVMVWGDGGLATSLVLHLARAWRARASGAGHRLRVSLIGPEADAAAGRLASWYPELEHACEVRPAVANATPHDLAQAALAEGGGQSPLVVYVCQEDDAVGLASGLALGRRPPPYAGKIVVCVEDEIGLARLLQESGWLGGRAGHVTVFPLLEHVGLVEVVLGGTHERLARAIHEDYLQAQTARGDRLADNPSLVPWNELPESLREANRRQADHIHTKLEALGCGLAPLTDWVAEAFAFTPDEVERLSQMEHARWAEDARAAGWRYAAGRKDAGRKTHPSLVAWEALPEDEKDKDRQAAGNLPRLVALAGLQIHRRDAPGAG